MPQLLLIYDPNDPPLQFSPSEDLRVRYAQMPLSEGLSDIDVCHVARHVAELLLEQLATVKLGSEDAL